eukprot:7067013-Prorocentrum_lima.AAC.1
MGGTARRGESTHGGVGRKEAGGGGGVVATAGRGVLCDRRRRGPSPSIGIGNRCSVGRHIWRWHWH